MTASPCARSVLAGCVALAVPLLARGVPGVPADPSGEPDARAVRAEVGAVYEAWGRARVALDAEAIDATLDPEFYVILDGRRISRDEFVTMILRNSPDRRLVRFDADILTVSKTGDGWSVVISEKLEVEVDGADGETRRACSFWITRDGWHKNDERWTATSSEAIGYETWGPGERPPFLDW